MTGMICDADDILMMGTEREAVVKEAFFELYELSVTLCYRLTRANGASRNTFGTGCRQIFNLTVEKYVDEQLAEQCKLTDIARDEKVALAILVRMLEAQVTPLTAPEVMEQLLEEI